MDACAEDPSRCQQKAGKYLGQDWANCPIRSILDDPELVAALQIEREANVSGLGEWPHGWAAWVPDMLSRLKAARDNRFSSEKRN